MTSTSRTQQEGDLGLTGECQSLGLLLSLQIQINISNINSVLIQSLSLLDLHLHSSCNWGLTCSSHELHPKKLFAKKVLKAVGFLWPALYISFKHTNLPTQQKSVPSYCSETAVNFEKKYTALGLPFRSQIIY